MKKRNIITASVLSAAMLMTACGSTGDSAPADPAADVGTENAGASAETENASDEETGSSSGRQLRLYILPEEMPMKLRFISRR